MNADPFMRRAALALLAWPALTACVSTDVGYQDVRSLTASRIQKDVRWYDHESTSESPRQTQELLSRPLDADAAAQVALLNNQGLQAAFAELGVARGELVEALRLPNPSVDAALRFPAGGSGRPAVEVEGLIDLSELLFLPMRNGASASRLDAAKLSVAGQVVDLAFETRLAFYAYQASAQTLELHRTILAALQASFETARALHEAGNITDLSFANERALYEESRVALTRSEAERETRRQALTALMGLWGRELRWEAQERLPEASPVDAMLAGLETRALARSLDLELRRRRFEAAAKNVNLSVARGWVPELRAGVAVEREAEGDAPWTVGPAVSLEVPLFYQRQGAAGIARANMRREQKLYVDTAVRIRSAARSSAAQLQATAKSAEYYRTVLLPLRQQIVDNTQLEYNAMAVSVFQLLQAKREQIETARAYVDVLREYWTLRGHVEQLLAGRLPRNQAATSGAGEPETNREPGGGAH